MSSGLRVGLRRTRKEVGGNESRKVIRSERTVVHPTSRQGLGAWVAAENLEGLESRGLLQTSSVTMVLGGHKRLDELCLSKIPHKMGHKEPG